MKTRSPINVGRGHTIPAKYAKLAEIARLLVRDYKHDPQYLKYLLEEICINPSHPYRQIKKKRT